MRNKLSIVVVIIAAFAAATFSQTTEFTYQGSLKDGSAPANGNYDFEFRLYDAASGGTQTGTLATRSGVAVADGIFTVKLDFGVVFDGADRFLEIRLRNAGGSGYTVLDPRQKLGSSPYAVKSLNAATATNATTATTATNATQLGGVAANQYVVTTDPRMTDARLPTGGSANYIQNTTSPQAVSNFNVSGNGTAGGTLSGNVLNAVTQLNINGLRTFTVNGPFNASNLVLAASNTFAGEGAGLNTTPDPVIGNLNGKLNSFFGSGAGQANTTGRFNAFFGSRAGKVNTTGGENAFFGDAAGLSNTTGSFNAFFGEFVGSANTTGGENAIFGAAAGQSNTTGNSNAVFGAYAGVWNMTGGFNAFFGHSAGHDNTTGDANAFFGAGAGSSTTTGNSNAFFGGDAGLSNTIGIKNTAVGNIANFSTGNLTFATAIGAESVASLSNSIFLGRSGGQDTVRIPGNTRLNGSGGLAVLGGTDVALGSGGYIVSGATTSTNIAIDDNEIMARNAGGTATLAINAVGGNVNLIQSGTGNVGIGTSAPGDKLDVDGDIRVGTSGTNGCLKNNNGGAITGTCSSDSRFKRNITAFPTVLNNLVRLRPVHYFWRANEFPDKGFGPNQTYGLLAQDVEKVLPDLVTIDAQGFKQVDYGKLPLLTIQAVKELNEQNETLKMQVNEQKAEIAALKGLVCGKSRKAKICRSK